MNKLSHSKNGFTLLEVLVSVVILAIGLLGIAGLQLTLIRDNHAAYMRSIAIAQTSNMMDRMRANYAGLNAGLYNSIEGIPDDISCTNCTQAQLAQIDAHEWNALNSQLLPQGQGTVTRNGSQYVISICWIEDRIGKRVCLPREVQL